MNGVARQAAMEVLRTIDQAVESGFLPAAPKTGGCKWCDFFSVCGPYEELRAGRKNPAPLVKLIRLREMA